MDMKKGNQIIAALLVVLVTAAVVGLVWTREVPANDQNAAAGKNATPATRGWRVDDRPLKTAKRMAALASTPEEQSLAHEALKTGDREVDLAFFDTLRTAQESPPSLSPQAKVLAERKKKTDDALKQDQD